MSYFVKLCAPYHYNNNNNNKRSLLVQLKETIYAY